jgi:hypothetical protein
MNWSNYVALYCAYFQTLLSHHVFYFSKSSSVPNSQESSVMFVVDENIMHQGTCSEISLAIGRKDWSEFYLFNAGEWEKIVCKPGRRLSARSEHWMTGKFLSPTWLISRRTFFHSKFSRSLTFVIVISIAWKWVWKTHETIFKKKTKITFLQPHLWPQQIS